VGEVTTISGQNTATLTATEEKAYQCGIVFQDGSVVFSNSVIPEPDTNKCFYTASLTAGESLALVFGDREAGTYTLSGDSRTGFQLKNEIGKYVVIVDSKIAESDTAFAWKYDGGLYTETKTSCKTGFWFWRKPTVKTVKQYLSFDGENFTLSSEKVCAKIQIAAAEHTYTYLHDGDGKHEAVCTKCGVHEEPEAHSYDKETGYCECGVLSPDLCYVSDVEVTEKTVSGCSREWWFGRRCKPTVKYQHSICPETHNVCVRKTEYSLDGGKTWKCGNCFQNDKQLSEFRIRITDSNGAKTTWQYRNGTCTAVQPN